MTGEEAWKIIQPLISPKGAVYNKEVSEAYIKCYVALKETDNIAKLKRWVKDEYKNREILENIAELLGMDL